MATFLKALTKIILWEYIIHLYDFYPCHLHTVYEAFVQDPNYYIAIVLLLKTKMQMPFLSKYQISNACEEKIIISL